MHQRSEQPFSIHNLIEQQRKLTNSRLVFERVVGNLWVLGMLKKRLAALSDRQSGQLLFDFVLGELDLLGPAFAICEDATWRLLRSGRGDIVDSDQGVLLSEERICTICGSEMLFRVGIEESDHWRCTAVGCGNKEYEKRS